MGPHSWSFQACQWSTHTSCSRSDNSFTESSKNRPMTSPTNSGLLSSCSCCSWVNWSSKIPWKQAEAVQRGSVRPLLPWSLAQCSTARPPGLLSQERPCPLRGGIKLCSNGVNWRGRNSVQSMLHSMEGASLLTSANMLSVRSHNCCVSFPTSSVLGGAFRRYMAAQMQEVGLESGLLPFLAQCAPGSRRTASHQDFTTAFRLSRRGTRSLAAGEERERERQARKHAMEVFTGRAQSGAVEAPSEGYALRSRDDDYRPRSSPRAGVTLPCKSVTVQPPSSSFRTVVNQ